MSSGDTFGTLLEKSKTFVTYSLVSVGQLAVYFEITIDFESQHRIVIVKPNGCSNDDGNDNESNNGDDDDDDDYGGAWAKEGEETSWVHVCNKAPTSRQGPVIPWPKKTPRWTTHLGSCTYFFGTDSFCTLSYHCHRYHYSNYCSECIVD